MKKPELRKTTLNNIITCAGVTAFFAICAVLSAAGILGSKLSGLLVLIGIHMILTVSLNLTVGILGELSLGHAGFMCVGAYVGGVFSILTSDNITNSAIRIVIAIIIGAFAAAVFGFLIGIPVLRLRGDYLAIVTLGFGEIIKSISNNIYLVEDKNGIHFSFGTPVTEKDAATAVDIFKGAQGIKAPQDTTLLLVVIVLLICLVVIMNLVDSNTGRACMAIRDNYIAAQSVGINVTKYRLIAFVISAAAAGAAGVLYSHCLAVLAPKRFDYNFSILILVYVVLGGLGSIRGSCISAVILYTLPELFRGLGNYRMLIYAVVLIFMMLFNNAPAFSGIKSKIASIFKKNKSVTEGGASR